MVFLVKLTINILIPKPYQSSQNGVAVSMFKKHWVRLWINSDFTLITLILIHMWNILFLHVLHNNFTKCTTMDYRSRYNNMYEDVHQITSSNLKNCMF